MRRTKACREARATIKYRVCQSSSQQAFEVVTSTQPHERGTCYTTTTPDNTWTVTMSAFTRSLVHVYGCISRVVPSAVACTRFPQAWRAAAVATIGKPRCQIRLAHIGRVLMADTDSSGSDKRKLDDAASAQQSFDAACHILDGHARTPERIASARPHLEHAASLGHHGAQVRLARWYLFGLGGLERDAHTAYSMLRDVAEACGDSDALYWLGRLLLEGPDDGSQAPAATQSDDGLVTFDESGARRKSGYEAAKAVLLEIRALRKAALRRKVRACAPRRAC